MSPFKPSSSQTIVAVWHKALFLVYRVETSRHNQLSFLSGKFAPNNCQLHSDVNVAKIEFQFDRISSDVHLHSLFYEPLSLCCLWQVDELTVTTFERRTMFWIHMERKRTWVSTPSAGNCLNSSKPFLYSDSMGLFFTLQTVETKRLIKLELKKFPLSDNTNTETDSYAY